MLSTCTHAASNLIARDTCTRAIADNILAGGITSYALAVAALALAAYFASKRI